MAIPEGRLSTTVVEGAFQPPENRVFYALISYERGPVAIEDTSLGLLYQDWTLTWNPSTGQLTATPETTGIPELSIIVADLVSISFTFDQNARISFAYTTTVSSYLYWYDSALAQTVTTDLGADAITPALLLDDKRDMESAANDMLLWYTKAEGGGTYELFMLRQRDRFLTEYSMATGLTKQYIHNIGMSSELRLQIMLKDKAPNLPYTP
jgi:predicted Rdx family selenoprotein